MQSIHKIELTSHLPAVVSLMSVCGLPSEDLGVDSGVTLYGAQDDSGALVGSVGLELFDETALLRSLAVSPEYQGRGLGDALLQYAQDAAVAQGVTTLYLLTTTAEDYFSHRGYQRLSRDDAPSAIRNTSQFSGLCPASSAFMKKSLCG